MSPKQYIDNNLATVNNDIKNSTKAHNAKGFIYDCLTVFTGVLGFFGLFAMPWFGVSLFATTAMFALGKKRISNMFPKTTKRLNGEKNHLNSRLKKGIDMSRDMVSRRRTSYKNAENNYKKSESDYKAAATANYLVNGVILGSTALAGIVGGPVFGLIPVIGAIAKNYYFDKKLINQHEMYQLTLGERNKLLHDNNISNMIINRRRRNVSAAPTRVINNPTNTRVNARQVTNSANGAVNDMSSYSDEDIRVVDNYISTLEQPVQSKGGVQKRKI